MECPACGNALREFESGSVVVDHCRDGCGGIWFDRLELKAVDESHEEVAALLLDRPSTQAAVDPEARRNCPRCDEVVMMRRFASVKREVAVDECPGCGGFWLDGGELPRIRSEYRTEADRKRAAHAFVGGTGDGTVAGFAAETAATIDRHQRLSWIFNLLCHPRHSRW